MIGPAGGKHMNKNSLLKICDLTSEEIFHILEDAAAFPVLNQIGNFRVKRWLLIFF